MLEPAASNGQSAQPPGRRRRYLLWVVAAILVLIICLGLIHACAKTTSNKKRPVPVVVASASSSDVPVYLSALGSVTPIDTVTVRSQVNGTVVGIFYQEGQMVKAGDLLVQIDPRPFEAQLIQFEGQLAHDVAQLANARVDLKRYQQLYPQGAVSQQVYATQAALVKELEGTVQFDQGQIDTVRVNLIYTRITSPIDGRVGLRIIDLGNYVQPSDTNGLVVVNDVQPITVVFALPEDDIPAVEAAMLAHPQLSVKAYDRTQHTLLSEGFLLTIDNQINSATGTVNLKAQFANQNLQLFPRQFVNVELLVNTLKQATIVPTAALRYGPQNVFVYLLNKNQTVSVHSVTPGPVSGENTVITAGISPNQQVVVEGADQLTDGSAVAILRSGNL